MSHSCKISLKAPSLKFYLPDNNCHLTDTLKQLFVIFLETNTIIFICCLLILFYHLSMGLCVQLHLKYSLKLISRGHQVRMGKELLFYSVISIYLTTGLYVVVLAVLSNSSGYFSILQGKKGTKNQHQKEQHILGDRKKTNNLICM